MRSVCPADPGLLPGLLKDAWVVLSVCPSCGTPQPVRPDETYFEVFGLSVQFSQNRVELEKRFYALSRLLHPDRLLHLSPTARAYSLERMSFVNQAYTTLKTPHLLRDYLLTLHGIQGSKNPPLEIVEAWFDIQERFLDRPESLAKRLPEFENHLRDFKQANQSDMQALENQYDQLQAQGLGSSESVLILEQLAKKVQTQSYLISLEKDVERMKKNVSYSN